MMNEPHESLYGTYTSQSLSHYPPHVRPITVSAPLPDFPKPDYVSVERADGVESHYHVSYLQRLIDDGTLIRTE